MRIGPVVKASGVADCRIQGKVHNCAAFWGRGMHAVHQRMWMLRFVEGMVCAADHLSEGLLSLHGDLVRSTRATRPAVAATGASTEELQQLHILASA